MTRFFALAFAGFILASQGSSLAAMQEVSVHPTVLRISRVISAQTQTITIYGYGFGENQPYNGNSNYFYMVDIQGNGTGWWRAGCVTKSGDCGTTLSVLSWGPRRIVVTGFTGDGLYPAKGDLVSFFIWNPQTGRGPAAASAMVR
jgi:hypothetical protein